jgi:HPt (histidine-containing phosphotransfer) domain-containing protein
MAVCGWDGCGVELTMVSKMSEKTRSASKDCISLDFAFLNENTFGDKVLRDEIISLFRAQLQTVDEALRGPLDQKDWRYITHTLKGAASAVGARQIAALAAKWEQEPVPATPRRVSICRLQFADTVFEFQTALTDLLVAG